MPMAGRGEDRLDGRRLHDLAGLHHRHTVRHLRHHPEVVGDEHRCRADVVARCAQDVQDLRLDRHVEGGRRLVGDEQPRAVRDRHRDHRPLTHPARPLVRVVLGATRRVRDADPL